MLILIIKGGLFAVLLILAAVWDIRKREIPDSVSLLILITGILAIKPLDAFMGLVLTGLPYFLAAIIIQKDNGFSVGGGDIKLMAGAGLLLGWEATILAFFIGCVLAAIIHPVRMRISHLNRILAFGPYLSVGIVIALLFGKQMVDWYLQTFFI